MVWWENWWFGPIISHTLISSLVISNWWFLHLYFNYWWLYVDPSIYIAMTYIDRHFHHFDIVDYFPLFFSRYLTRLVRPFAKTVPMIIISYWWSLPSPVNVEIYFIVLWLNLIMKIWYLNHIFLLSFNDEQIPLYRWFIPTTPTLVQQQKNRKFVDLNRKSDLKYTRV